MKYGFMTFSCPDATLEETLSIAQRFGYTGIEPRLDKNHSHGIEVDIGPAGRTLIKQQAAKAGIDICCLATSCSYADPAAVDQAVEHTRRRIDLAADVGSSRIRVFGGRIPKGINREQATEQLVRALSSVADQAASRGVIVCMETHDDWCDPAHMAVVMKRVNHPAIGVTWDVMHPVFWAGKIMDEAFRTLQPWIRHVHFHDGVKVGDGGLELRPMGDGQLDHARALTLLYKDGYDGYLSGEWIGWQPCEVHLPRELAAMKKFEENCSQK